MINKILFIFIAIIYIGCNEEPASSNEDQSSDSNSTLGDSNISGHDVVGNIDDYFYDFDEGYTPYVNSKFQFKCRKHKKNEPCNIYCFHY